MLSTVFLTLAFLFSVLCQDYSKLTFNAKGKFKIVQFTDTHFGETALTDSMTQDVMRKILESEKPDLVAVTGDVVSGYLWDGHTKPWFPLKYKKFAEIMQEYNQKWAFTAGNHDSEADYNRLQVLDEDRKYAPLSLTQLG